MLFLSVEPSPRIKFHIKVGSKKTEGEALLTDIVDIKGWKAVGNRLSDKKISDVEVIEPLDAEEPPVVEEGQQTLF